MLDLKNKTVLIIAPHPDDEVFGCGGLIYTLKSKNCSVFVLFMTVGTTSDFSNKGESSANQRMEEMKSVMDFLRIDGYTLALPGNQYHLQLDSVPQKDLVHIIERGSDISLQTIKPDVVLTTPPDDYNQDHRVVSTATVTATRPAAKQFKSFQPLVLFYELPYQQWNTANTLAAPNLYIELSEEAMKTKKSALEIYDSQLKSSDSPLSTNGVTALASYRGLQCGGGYAEAFWIRRLVTN